VQLEHSARRQPAEAVPEIASLAAVPGTIPATVCVAQTRSVLFDQALFDAHVCSASVIAPGRNAHAGKVPV